MAKPCSICIHPHRADIEKAMIAGTSYREITGQYGPSKSSLERHKNGHLREMLAAIAPVPVSASETGTSRYEPIDVARAAIEHQEAERVHALDVFGQIQRAVDRVNKLIDACDEWLADPDRPGRYTLDPRAHEIDVIYVDNSGEKPVRKRGQLDELLERLEQGGRCDPVSLRWRVADPRTLVNQTAMTLKAQMQLLADIRLAIQDRQEIERFQQVVLDVIHRASPEASSAVCEALRQFDTSQPLLPSSL